MTSFLNKFIQSSSCLLAAKLLYLIPLISFNPSFAPSSFTHSLTHTLSLLLTHPLYEHTTYNNPSQLHNIMFTTTAATNSSSSLCLNNSPPPPPYSKFDETLPLPTLFKDQTNESPLSTTSTLLTTEQQQQQEPESIIDSTWFSNKSGDISIEGKKSYELPFGSFWNESTSEPQVDNNCVITEYQASVISPVKTTGLPLPPLPPALVRHHHKNSSWQEIDFSSPNLSVHKHNIFDNLQDLENGKTKKLKLSSSCSSDANSSIVEYSFRKSLGAYLRPFRESIPPNSPQRLPLAGRFFIGGFFFFPLWWVGVVLRAERADEQRWRKANIIASVLHLIFLQLLIFGLWKISKQGFFS